MALILSARGKPAEAVTLLQPLIDTGEPPTLNALAIALSDSGRHAEALGVLQKALQKDPKNAHGFETLGMVELRLQRPQQAVEHLRQALAIKDDLPIAWNTLGVALYQIEGPAAAVEAWQRSVTLDPKQFDALYNLGLVAANLGRRAEARKALRQFVDTAPPQRFAADIQKAQGILRELGG
jgi:tetratricopeptide (TPR) repeat protein